MASSCSDHVMLLNATAPMKQPKRVYQAAWLILMMMDDYWNIMMMGNNWRIKGELLEDDLFEASFGWRSTIPWGCVKTYVTREKQTSNRQLF